MKFRSITDAELSEMRSNYVDFTLSSIIEGLKPTNETRAFFETIFAERVPPELVPGLAAKFINSF